MFHAFPQTDKSLNYGQLLEKDRATFARVRDSIQKLCFSVDLLNPAEERVVGEDPYLFPGGDKEIVQCALGISEEKSPEKADGDTQNDEDDDEGEKDVLPELSLKAKMDICAQLERFCTQYPEARGVEVLELQQNLRKLRGHLRHIEFTSQTQTAITSYFVPPSTS